MVRKVTYEVEKIEEILRSFDENLGLKGFSNINTVMSAVQYLQSSGERIEEGKVTYEVEKIEDILRSFDTNLEVRGFTQINTLMSAVRYLQSGGEIIEVDETEEKTNVTECPSGKEENVVDVTEECSMEDVYCVDQEEEK